MLTLHLKYSLKCATADAHFSGNLTLKKNVFYALITKVPSNTQD